ncbi:hypothetical protein HSR122_2200 [Halapricum desulfuricans]|uniref:Uncharacterized protein n=1 Tax=Halapricum desulfuricans TaxID=2841257 RepID=A0A897NB07_9EURY|nr:hypothetical protein HSR122_2200 [Halapricum desulfuricans]
MLGESYWINPELGSNSINEKLCSISTMGRNVWIGSVLTECFEYQ